MLSANEFVEELKSLLTVEDGLTRIGIAEREVFVIFSPEGVGSAYWRISGFNRVHNTPVEKVQVREEQNIYDRHLRRKTGTPEAIAQYLADFLNELAAELPKYAYSSVCEHVQADTGSCGHPAMVPPGASCPWSGEWKDASRECPMYQEKKEKVMNSNLKQAVRLIEWSGRE